MKEIVIPFSAKLRRSYMLESRFVFWNLVFSMLASSLLLVLYLKRILAF
jgi:hypothetical protein